MVGIFAPINWNDPKLTYEGDYFSLVSTIASCNPDLDIHILKLKGLHADGTIDSLQISSLKRGRKHVSEFKLLHFLELEDYEDSSKTFETKWKEVLSQMDVLENYNQGTINSTKATRYALDKNYLFDLQNAGIPIIPTSLVPSQISLDELKTKTTNAVIKPLKGECGKNVHLLEEISEEQYHALQQQGDYFLLQPYLKETKQGEKGLLFFKDQMINAILRTPKDKNRIGGLTAHAYLPSNEEINFGLSVYQSYKHHLDIYRVDFIDTANGPLLMEVEAVDPFHYPQYFVDYPLQIGSFYKKCLDNFSIPS